MTEPITPLATAAGPVTQLIQVQYDPSSLTLTVSRPLVLIYPGDTVVWSFLGIPEGWTPWIEFRRVGNEAFVGPLTGLTQAEGAIWGLCRTSDWTGTDPVSFEYRATMQRGFATGWDTEGSIVWSKSVRLVVQPNQSGAEIAYTVAPGSEPQQLLVLPEEIQILRDGDVMVWQFPSDLAEGGLDAWRPRIKFRRYEGTGTVPNQQLGPFAALSILPGSIRGTGNNGVTGLYFFEVALVSVSTGEIGWLSSGDPVIDNRNGVDIPD